MKYFLFVFEIENYVGKAKPNKQGHLLFQVYAENVEAAYARVAATLRNSVESIKTKRHSIIESETAVTFLH